MEEKGRRKIRNNRTKEDEEKAENRRRRKKIGPGKEGEGKTAAEESLSCLDELSPGFLVSSICASEKLNHQAFFLFTDLDQVYTANFFER